MLVPPNTYLSEIDISFWPKPYLEYVLNNKNSKNIKVVVEGRMSEVKYSDMGIVLDVEKTMDQIDGKSLREILGKWLFLDNTRHLIQPYFDIDENYDQLAIEKLPKRSLLNEGVNYMKANGFFEYLADQRKAKVDTVDLLTKLVTFSRSNNDTYELRMIDEDSELEKRVDFINKKLKIVHSNPLELVIEGTNKTITIEPKDIRQMIEIVSTNLLDTVNIEVNKENVSKILESKNINIIATDWTVKKLQNSLIKRYEEGVINPVVLGADDGPNTVGNIADKYIEVDLSQQKMYFFENGDLSKSYSVSTGLNYPTPVGSYKIKNKSPIGYSGIFNVWMPWWMAFEYREDIGAYLGIHELPYRLVNGEKYYRFGNYIGNRKTGGCVALSPGEAKEVYDKSYPGMDVLIYQ